MRSSTSSLPNNFPLCVQNYLIYPGESSSMSQRKAPQRETQAALGRWSEGRCTKARMQKLDSSRPNPGRMEETLEGDEAHPGL
jgi:hypothetical protein